MANISLLNCDNTATFTINTSASIVADTANSCAKAQSNLTTITSDNSAITGTFVDTGKYFNKWSYDNVIYPYNSWGNYVDYTINNLQFNPSIITVENIYNIPSNISLYEGLIVYATREQQCYIWRNNKFEKFTTSTYSNTNNNTENIDIDLVILYFL